MQDIGLATEKIKIDREICGYCGSCVSVCGELALTLVDACLILDRSRCTGCLTCLLSCPVGAIKKLEVTDGQKV